MDLSQMTEDELIYYAQLSESAERFEDMVEAMKVYAEKFPLDPKCRNMFSVSFKNTIGTRRSAWRVMASIITKAKPEVVEYYKKYTKIIESELDKICDDINKILDKLIDKSDDHSESKVFFLKMKGDYCRYKAEYLNDDANRKISSEVSEGSYKAAYDIAVKELSTTNPIRLGLALNFSVFHFEIKNDAEQACKLAKAAFDDAIKNLDTLDEEHYKDSTLILQLLRDNLTLWTADDEDDESD